MSNCCPDFDIMVFALSGSNDHKKCKQTRNLMIQKSKQAEGRVLHNSNISIIIKNVKGLVTGFSDYADSSTSVLVLSNFKRSQKVQMTTVLGDPNVKLSVVKSRIC